MIKGNIEVLDPQYGNVWTNIPDSLIKKIKLHYGDSLQVELYDKNIQKFSGVMPFITSFSGVPDQHQLAYLNSLLHLSFAINRGNFAGKYNIASGPDWSIIVRKKT